MNSVRNKTPTKHKTRNFQQNHLAISIRPEREEKIVQQNRVTIKDGKG